MKKLEIGEKRPLSPGYTVDQNAKQAESDLIEDQMAKFLLDGGVIEQLPDFGVSSNEVIPLKKKRINTPKNIFLNSVREILQTSHTVNVYRTPQRLVCRGSARVLPAGAVLVGKVSTVDEAKEFYLNESKDG